MPCWNILFFYFYLPHSSSSFKKKKGLLFPGSHWL